MQSHIMMNVFKMSFQAGLSHLSQLLRASPPNPLSIFGGEGEEVLANELLRRLAARYGATVAHLRRIFLGFSLSLPAEAR